MRIINTDKIIKQRYELAGEILDEIIPLIFTISIQLANANTAEAVEEVLESIDRIPEAFYRILE